MMSSQPVPSLSYAARRETIERMSPTYHAASLAQKGLLLDTVVAVTGYARKYAIHLLNKAPEGKRTIRRRRSSRYGSGVQQALLEAWKATKRICPVRLIPYLPTLVADLERHGHLDLNQESRSRLLAMSATTAERLLRPHRKSAPRGLSTTQTGPLLKQQIPIRTFHGWDETRPGFLEADLVAHCGEETRGSYLYTLTLTDVATGWTECLPVLYKGAEAVLSAFQQARGLFPFPILGLDTDSGVEFINEPLRSYCEAEQITFTRGREGFKQDQCYVEQKNGAIVRQFVGFERLVGEQAYWQLRELYRAVRLFVNCFQPSMKLVCKECDAEHVRRVYDPARMPWQRLVLSGILPESSQQSFSEVVQVLDPLEVLHQLERLQRALWCCAAHSYSPGQRASAAPVLRFWVQCCLQGSLVSQEEASACTSVLHKLQGEPKERVGLLDWPRTSRDPFEGQWELILSLVLAHPDWSGNDLFQEMQRQFPGRYRPLQQSTLQIGLRKIRARLLAIMQEPWPQEVLQRQVPLTASAGSDQREQEAGGKIEVVRVSSACFSLLLPQEPEGGRPVRSEAPTEEPISNSVESVPSAVKANRLLTHFGNFKWTHPEGERKQSSVQRTCH
jgi:hypothetical protein